MSREFTSLTQLLEHIEKTAKRRKRVSLDLVVRAVGRRAFAPLLLLAGIILFSPLSGIPGVPTLMAILVLLVTVQLLLGRRRFWLPHWLLNRSMSKEKLLKTLDWLHKPAYWSDLWLRPRLMFLVHRSGTYVIAVICTVIALGLPVMEIVPFSATFAGMALAAFGLALVAHDGVLAVLAFTFTALVFALIAGALL
ncbi:exopolysaccharide biosynthesis protein [Microbulbifer thermotolerans]|uniref:exopolysaccharide biosynthesis protein n=1 Tax=Microbulbifer thermotolerans TaxID=252514 RepID=UPI0008EC65A3|nr:exopolysaccharide biosynthesis protein [Microbulbifer thermotolerans]MCX2780358.1 exopolysaccharide biosynthesis protein [Microbulbifer thermotolerans]MCX2782519.1 exopolysaccharide biosynthesis protein [Microbulbifer thermotolerans]MCX2794531.1 exopolysaccharide biosynthesis protein [Microbulbifer thermotolerans]MCX2805970.1 exopolysaccharide biosynthesis protein [Microbulbifer thermotolerans]MCX2832627.1 exopolysaccharide biosynthesis protein [Microbulbifer thermotolerans]